MGTESTTARRLPWAVMGLSALLLTSCGDGGEDGAEPPEDQATAQAEGTEAEQADPPTADEIAEYIADAEWTFEDRGPDGPQVIQLTGGEAEDDLGRTYTMGEELIEGDATGDGAPDVAVSLTQADGNAVDQQWFIWVGNAAEESETVAQQVLHPIGRSTSCGDAATGVSAAEDGGFEIQENFRHDMEDGPCAEPGPDELHKVVEVSPAEDGELLPVQTAPVEAWGGLCPRTDSAVSGGPAELQAFPGEEAPAVEAAWAEEVEAAEDSLLADLAGDHGFFRFTPEGYEPEGETTVDQFCGFSLGGEEEQEQPEDGGDALSGDRVNPEAYEMTGFDDSGDAVGWGFQTPSGRHSCGIFEGYDDEGYKVACLISWDDIDEVEGLPDDLPLAPVPSLDASGGQIEMHGGIPFPGSPETTLGYGEVLEVEGIACTVEESGITCTAGEEWMEASGSGYEFSTDNSEW